MKKQRAICRYCGLDFSNRFSRYDTARIYFSAKDLSFKLEDSNQKLGCFFCVGKIRVFDNEVDVDSID